MLDLIREGDLRPTAAAVADRAGVSLRLVFHHFKDMETLMQHALGLQAQRIAPLIAVPIAPRAPLQARLKLFAARRAALYEEITPVRRAARLLEDRSPIVAEGLTRMRAVMRDQLAFLFRDELARVPAPVGEAAQALTSWLGWETLRHQQGLDPAEAQEAIVEGLRALLTPARPTP